MEIRTLREADAAAWWQLRLESLTNEPFAFGKAVEEHRELTIEAVASRFRETPATNFHLGAFEDGNLIGMATFIRDTDLKQRHKGHIFGVYVSASHRRKGLARALLADILERAKRDPSLEQILLAVATTQKAAKQLYSGFGFESWGIEPNALKIGATYIDEEYMILRVR